MLTHCFRDGLRANEPLNAIEKGEVDPPVTLSPFVNVSLRGQVTPRVPRSVIGHACECRTGRANAPAMRIAVAG